MTTPGSTEWDRRIADAAVVVGGHLAPTPLVPITLDGFAAPTYLKLETLQPTGSFKVRGALAAVAASAADGRRVVTASAGNHGLGIAYAATRMGARATVVVPQTASPAKVEALRRFDIDLRLIGDGYDGAESAAQKIAYEDGARYISAYTDPDVIAGQATVVREIADALPGPAQIVVPVGGGGLVSGTVLGVPDRYRVLGVESAASLAVSASMAAGRIVQVPVGSTIADGLAGNIAPDTLAPSILTAAGVDVIAADELAIERAVTALAIDHGIVCEGSGAVGIAAAMNALMPTDLPTVFVITGRNITGPRLAALLVP
ncbi:threonine/serine dehydratase [Promicromonospora sukumoe]|uniref:Threonine dehydratase n=1 Tax=Promicromonospora sukumoe TaxID=88382 RepID=A0A7W3J7E8_9MICO|nr:pyridoxal-phosphate dependent enzyme [Promicromonospora sukumoe]MBA8807692.1 threonine dehydratase [Promicromonospora sukumoe]